MRTTLALVALTLGAPHLHGQTTWYVDASGSAPGTGTIADPFTSIQYGIDRPFVVDGDTLSIAPGIYYEHVDLFKDLLLQGEDRDSVILDGQGTGRVVTASAGGLESMTLRNGVASEGGGLLVATPPPSHDSFDAFRVRVMDCSADYGGGVGHQSSRHLTLRECELVDNTATWSGGGLATFTDYEQASVLNCLITGNEASRGGGVSTGLGAFWVADTLLADNLANVEGGGIHCGFESSLQVTDSELRGNRAGGLAGRGGGIHSDPFASTHVRGTVFESNVAEGMQSKGGAAWGGWITSCTLSGNQAAEGSGLYEPQYVDSCIIWGSPAPAISAGPAAVYSIVQGGYPGALDADPMFWSSFTGDLRLMPGSPAIDAGNPGLPQDQFGTPAEIGALAFDAAYSPPPTNYCEGNTNSAGCLADIYLQGSPTLSGPDDCLLGVSGAISGNFGVFVWSMEPAMLPFMGTTLCLAHPLFRAAPVQVTGSGCLSVATMPLSQDTLASTIGGPYQQAYAQFWYRDPMTLPHGIGMSDALEFVVLP